MTKFKRRELFWCVPFRTLPDRESPECCSCRKDLLLFIKLILDHSPFYSFLILKNEILHDKIFKSFVSDCCSCAKPKGELHHFLCEYPVNVACDCSQMKRWIPQFVLYWQRQLSFLSLSCLLLAVPTCTRMHCAQASEVAKMDQCTQQ